jgi:hypothetical protein
MNRETDTIFLQTLGRFIQAQVQLATVPLLQKIDDLEKRIVTLQNIQSFEATALRDDAIKVSKELDGAIEGFAAEIARVEKVFEEKHATLTNFASLIDTRFENLPKPKDGADGKDAVVDYDTIADVIKTSIENEIAKFSVVDGKDGEPGKDADMDALFSYIENYMKAIPIPQNGKDGKDGEKGESGIAGRDGADVVAAFRDSDRHLVLTLSNGVVKDIGQVHGTDGKDGINGRDGIDYDLIKFVQDDDDPRVVNVVHDGVKGEHIGSFRIPGFVDKGVWRAGKYQQGDSVSFGGSMFIARVDTAAKPEASPDWRLSVKRGLDGAAGKDGKTGERGPAGNNGRDLTQLGPDGKKW